MQNRESGITLVMAIVMMATVTFVSFALSSIIIRELVVARVILRTEPAISGANSGGEIGLYRLFRNLGATGVSGTTSSGGAGYSVTTDYYDDPYYFSVQPGQAITVGLYDAEDINKTAVAYRSFLLSVNPGSAPVQYQAVSWSTAMVPCDPGNPSGDQCFSTPVLCPWTVPGSQTSTCNLTGPDYRYIISITHSQQSGPPATGSVKAFSQSGGGGSALGVPADLPTLDITGAGNGVQRKIQIKL